MLFMVALKTPLASTPGWEKKFLSSADKNELITFFGIASKGDTKNSFFFGKISYKASVALNKPCLILEVYNSSKIYNLGYY